MRALSGFDVALTAAEMDRLGIVLRPAATIVVEESMAGWRTHSEYSGMNPSADAVDRQYARHLARAHLDAQARAAAACPTCRRAAGSPCRPSSSADPRAVASGIHQARRREAESLGALSLRGLALPRSFPCLGTLRVLDRTGPTLELQCDLCGHEVGALPERAPPAEPSGALGKPADYGGF